jgi:hypothetical protein
MVSSRPARRIVPVGRARRKPSVVLANDAVPREEAAASCIAEWPRWDYRILVEIRDTWE